MNTRVLAAMSGGVDSSFTAALLQQQGYVVEGVTMKLFPGVCCDIASAQSVCAHLGIPHRIVNMQREFEDHVVRGFIEEYCAGRTPNPCIRCNDVIKFKVLLAYARENGFAFLATGHYARVELDPVSRRHRLMTGVDTDKDQSYFLYRLTQEQLGHVLFPLGGMFKRDVRRLAREMRLPAAERPESQDICFVPNNDYRTFLKEHAPDVLRRGEIVMTDGSVVGKHEGVAFYTVGQRRGLGVAAGGRLYVVRIEPGANRVVLGQRRDLETLSVEVSDVRFLPFDRLEAPLSVGVKVRYRSALQPATIRPIANDRIAVDFEQPVAGVTPGQAAVFYDGDTVVGGGTISG
ncbi:MAG: tRNA 2-thiouridine(34) synthase MnmA [Nitrospirota bacterium]